VSIINNAHPGSNLRVLTQIDRVLLRMGKPVERERLLELCRPDNLPKTTGAGMRFQAELNFWLKQGLWLSQNDVLAPHPGARPEDLPFRVMQVLVQHDAQRKSRRSLTDSEAEPVLPFFRGISCLLALKAHTFIGGIPLTRRSMVETIIAHLPDGLNENHTLDDLGDFLGFLEPWDRNAQIVDPTRAIEAVLPSLLKAGKEVALKEFIASLAERLPVLDGGLHRMEAENLMVARGWQPPPQHLISASLSQALIRLWKSGRIILEQKADDADHLELLFPEGGRPFSVVRLHGASA